MARKRRDNSPFRRKMAEYLSLKQEEYENPNIRYKRPSHKQIVQYIMRELHPELTTPQNINSTEYIKEYRKYSVMLSRDVNNIYRNDYNHLLYKPKARKTGKRTEIKLQKPLKRFKKAARETKLPKKTKRISKERQVIPLYKPIKGMFTIPTTIKQPTEIIKRRPTDAFKDLDLFTERLLEAMEQEPQEEQLETKGQIAKIIGQELRKRPRESLVAKAVSIIPKPLITREHETYIEKPSSIDVNIEKILQTLGQHKQAKKISKRLPEYSILEQPQIPEEELTEKRDILEEAIDQLGKNLNEVPELPDLIRYNFTNDQINEILQMQERILSKDHWRGQQKNPKDFLKTFRIKINGENRQFTLYRLGYGAYFGEDPEQHNRNILWTTRQKATRGRNNKPRPGQRQSTTAFKQSVLDREMRKTNNIVTSAARMGFKTLEDFFQAYKSIYYPRSFIEDPQTEPLIVFFTLHGYLQID